MFSNTFAGIAPASVPGFVLAQIAGGGAHLAVRALYPVTAAEAEDVVLPHHEDTGTDASGAQVAGA